MTDPLYARAAPLLEAEIDEEIVGLDREQGEVFGFNAVASTVWRLLEQPRTARDLCVRLVESYDVPGDQCAAEVAELLDQMIEMRLVERIPAPDRGGATDIGC